MKTIAIANRKGGTGKTTLAAHLAAGLAVRQGYNVCIVDTDSQGHIARLLGQPKENGLYNLIVNKARLADVIRPVPAEVWAAPDDASGIGSLWYIPSDTDTYIIPFKVQSALALRNQLNKLEQMNIDVCIIDTAPTASMFDGSVYFAADAVIFVTQTEALSFDGIQESFREIEILTQEREELLPPVHILGIVPNKVKGNTLVHRNNLAQLRETFGDLVWAPIPQRTLWTESSNYGQLVYSFAPTSAEAKDAWTLVDETLEAIEAWPVAK